MKETKNTNPTDWRIGEEQALFCTCGVCGKTIRTSVIAIGRPPQIATCRECQTQFPIPQDLAEKAQKSRRQDLWEAAGKRAVAGGSGLFIPDC